MTTSDCEVAVKGTIFAVNHGLKGSRVSVIEGEVEVRQGGTESMLLPGDQLTTDDRLQRRRHRRRRSPGASTPKNTAGSWPNSPSSRYEVAEAVDIAAPRTSTRLLDLAPADTTLYVAMPNLTEGLGAARQIFSSRLAESEVLRDWWQREIVANNIDTQIEESLDQLQFLGDAVGDEVVVTLGLVGSGRCERPAHPRRARRSPGLPLAGSRSTWRISPTARSRFNCWPIPTNPSRTAVEVLIWVTDDLVVAARTADLIRGVAARLDGTVPTTFVGTELHQTTRRALRDRRRVALRPRSPAQLCRGHRRHQPRGRRHAGAPRSGFDATTMVFERHRDEIGSKIDADIRFNGPRRGVAAWLAEPAPLATLDFVSQDAYLVSAAAAKDGDRAL